MYGQLVIRGWGIVVCGIVARGTVGSVIIAGGVVACWTYFASGFATWSSFILSTKKTEVLEARTISNCSKVLGWFDLMVVTDEKGRPCKETSGGEPNVQAKSNEDGYDVCG